MVPNWVDPAELTRLKLKITQVALIKLDWTLKTCKWEKSMEAGSTLGEGRK